MAKDHLKKLKEELNSGEALLLDIREKEEWDAGHLENANFVPLSALKEGVSPEISPTKKIYLHCRTGRRVFPANELLKAMGFETVIPLNEGFAELVHEGFPAAKK